MFANALQTKIDKYIQSAVGKLGKRDIILPNTTNKEGPVGRARSYFFRIFLKGQRGSPWLNGHQQLLRVGLDWSWKIPWKNILTFPGGVCTKTTSEFHYPKDPCMVYLPTFTIKIHQM